jgi:hypothetical protein
MSWNFSLAMEAEFSPTTYSDFGLSAQSSRIPTASDDSCSDKMKGTWHHSPFGMMYVPSTAAHGVESLKSYLAAFPAKPIPRQLAEGTMLMISGRKCDGSWQMSLAENTQRRAIDRAADDLESMGYSARAIALGADDLGADHIRKRYWLLAHTNGDRELFGAIDAKVAELSRVRPRVWDAYPDESRMADGLANRMDRLEATGDGQVPIVAATAFTLLSND